MYNLNEVRAEVLGHLRTTHNPIPVYHIAIPDVDTLKRNAKGQITPYIAVQILMPQNARGESFAGVWSADYDLPVNLQVITADADLSGEIAAEVFESMLGFGISFGSGFRPRFGGAVLPLTSNDGTIQAFIHPMSFSARVQLFKS